jgi:uncharacterized membrane protein
MDRITWALTEDLPRLAVIGVAGLVLLAVALLAIELRHHGARIVLTFLTGVFGALLLGAAVLRPTVITTKGQLAGPPVTVLVDESRRMLLPAGDGTRRERAKRAVAALRESMPDARIEVLGFGDGELTPAFAEKGDAAELTTHSDLQAALDSIAQRPGQRPRAIVVVSDGRLTRPTTEVDEQALKRTTAGVPVHTVSVGKEAPKDASVRSVRATGTAVAHQAFALAVEVGCDERLDCGEVPVVVRELLEGEPPSVLASGKADARGGQGTIELQVTLERAGPRIVEVAIDAPDGDEVPENDSRLLDFRVTRDRVRILHVAGRPTYDVRALRMFLKSDESIDLVAFFILRTLSDRTDADDSELALIPFPVDELFTEHLPSFDAVILQDIDAVEYKLQGHLPALAAYVRGGGGLIMVGGPAGFVGGGYAGTKLEDVLPIELDARAEPFDRGAFVPRYTESGRAAPLLGPLRHLLDERLPRMSGSNTLGPSRPGAIVLWDHPTRRATGEGRDTPMPVLAVSEVGDGRSIALGVDGTHLLTFSSLGAETAGRAHGALWEGLLGWLMRDPRYEPAQMELARPCIVGQPAELRLLPLPGMEGPIELELSRLGEDSAGPVRPGAALKKLSPVRREGRAHVFDLGLLEAGGYLARATLGNAPAARFVFPCERGGEALGDSRPDAPRLESIARATGGVSTSWDRAGDVPKPAVTMVAAERRTSPLLPPWAWTLLAAAMMGAHWIVRRASGLA